MGIVRHNKELKKQFVIQIKSCHSLASYQRHSPPTDDKILN